MRCILHLNHQLEGDQYRILAPRQTTFGYGPSVVHKADIHVRLRKSIETWLYDALSYEYFGDEGLYDASVVEDRPDQAADATADARASNTTIGTDFFQGMAEVFVGPDADYERLDAAAPRFVNRRLQEAEVGFRIRLNFECSTSE